MSVDRIPPASLEAEMAVLGSALIDRDALECVMDLLVPADFYALIHEIIFDAIVKLYHAERPVDKLLLAEQLRIDGHLEKIGGVPSLNALMDVVPTAASVAYYAGLVREKSMLRDLVRAGTAIAGFGYDGEDDVDDAVARAESAFTRAIDRGLQRAGGVSLGDAMWRNYQRLVERASGMSVSEEILTPWKGLNDLIGPMLPGEMVIWPAQPKTGKSALLFMLADYIAAHYGQVALVSLEMLETAVAMRYGALYGGVSARRQRGNPPLDEVQLRRVLAAADIQAARPIQLYDLQSVSRLSDLRRELRLLAKRGRIRALCIDGVNFLGDIDAERGDRSNKNDRLDFVYRSLLKFAKEFGLVVHAVQHVNRASMGQPPQLKDIRDGGNPEGHAHAIVAPFRPTPDGTIEERKEGKFVVLGAREGESGVVEDLEYIGYRSMWVERGRAPWFEAQPASTTDAPEFDLAIGGAF